MEKSREKKYFKKANYLNHHINFNYYINYFHLYKF